MSQERDMGHPILWGFRLGRPASGEMSSILRCKRTSHTKTSSRLVAMRERQPTPRSATDTNAKQGDSPQSSTKIATIHAPINRASCSNNFLNIAFLVTMMRTGTLIAAIPHTCPTARRIISFRRGLLVPSRLPYLNFKVVSASSANTSARNQKRAITIDSDQPFSSK